MLEYSVDYAVELVRDKEFQYIHEIELEYTSLYYFEISPRPYKRFKLY